MSECPHIPDGPTTRCGDHQFSYCGVCRKRIKRLIAPWSLVEENDAAQSALCHKVYKEAFDESLAKSEGTKSAYGGFAKAQAIARSAVKKMCGEEES